jgi:hypothetical protein
MYNQNIKQNKMNTQQMNARSANRAKQTINKPNKKYDG